MRQGESRAHPDERQAGRHSLPDLLAVLGVVAAVVRRFPERVKHGLVLRCDPVPRLAEARDGRRVERGEDGEEGVVVGEGEEALRGNTSQFSRTRRIEQAGRTSPTLMKYLSSAVLLF